MKLKEILKFFLALTLLILGACCSSCGNDASNAKKLDKEELKQTLELKISTDRQIFNRNDPVNVKLEFIGHPEYYRGPGAGRQQFSILPDVDILREANAGMGILLELFHESGEKMFFKDESVWMRKVVIPRMKETDDHVYRTLDSGVLETVELPLSEWIDFKKSGNYVLKVHYQVFDAASFWRGPVASNKLVFAISAL